MNHVTIFRHTRSSKDVPLVIYKLLAILTNNTVDQSQLNLVQLENALHLIDKNVPETIKRVNFHSIIIHLNTKLMVKYYYEFFFFFFATGIVKIT